MQPSNLTVRRRDIRYPIRLPVAVKVATTEISARSQNLSLAGILLSSEFMIPEGTTVELAVGVSRMPEHVYLTARGRVLRVHHQASGQFSMAVACEHPFRITPRNPSAIFEVEP